MALRRRRQPGSLDCPSQECRFGYIKAGVSSKISCLAAAMWNWTGVAAWSDINIGVVVHAMVVTISQNDGLGWQVGELFQADSFQPAPPRGATRSFLDSRYS